MTIIDISNLQEIQKYNYCWSIGYTRLGNFECRIWDKNQFTPKEFNKVFIISESSFEKSIEVALLEFENWINSDKYKAYKKWRKNGYS